MWRTGRQGPPISAHPCPSGEGGASRTGGALDMPSSWRGGIVGVCYLHLDVNG